VLATQGGRRPNISAPNAYADRVRIVDGVKNRAAQLGSEPRVEGSAYDRAIRMEAHGDEFAGPEAGDLIQEQCLVPEVIVECLESDRLPRVDGALESAARHVSGLPERSVADIDRADGAFMTRLNREKADLRLASSAALCG
jgi:hypothetical protein